MTFDNRATLPQQFEDIMDVYMKMKKHLRSIYSIKGQINFKKEINWCFLIYEFYQIIYVVDKNGNIVGEPIVGAITEKNQAKTLEKLIDQALQVK